MIREYITSIVLEVLTKLLYSLRCTCEDCGRGLMKQDVHCPKHGNLIQLLERISVD